MVITRLISGLGNQLFQYAIGRKISRHLNVPLKFDISWYQGLNNRDYNLYHFNIDADIATPEEIEHAKSHFYYREKSFQYDPRYLAVPSTVYLEGYWQSELYFKDIAGQIRQELRLKTLPSVKNIVMAKAIQSCQSVSLHIRRGDYLLEPALHNCLLDYYDRAIGWISGQINDPHFFVFSDDGHWAQANLKPDFPMTFVLHNDEKHCYEDLRLIRFCKHHITANSTFSWWGAWLSQSPHKLVCAPQRWFNPGFHEEEAIVPHDWIKL
jgi:hypothetical protein